MVSKGWIGSINKGVVKGWAIGDSGTFSLFHEEEHITDIKTFSFRQDVLDMGYSDGNAGFEIDITSYLETVSGDVVISLKHNKSILANYETYAPSRTSLIKNDYLALSDMYHVEDWQLTTNNRGGLKISQFMASSRVKHANTYYTRFAFGDHHNTKSLFELIPALQLPNEVFSPKKLRLAIVGRASHELHLQAILIDSKGQRVFQEPVLIADYWSHQVVDVEKEFTGSLFSGELVLKLSTQNYGPHSIDLAMVQLSEGLIPPVALSENPAEPSDFYGQNILFNGDLSKWPNGVIFNNLQRGQELAENWFIEMSRANAANLSVAVQSDTLQSDPLSRDLRTKVGIRVRGNKLDGYARLVLPFAKANFVGAVFLLEIDIEAIGLNKRVVIPRIYITARGSKNDKVVHFLVRKQVIIGREKVSLSINSLEAESLLKKAKGLPVLNIAIDLPERNEFCIYSASLTPIGETVSTLDMSDSRPEGMQGLHFEDDGITKQLDILKGLDEWRSNKTITHVEEVHSATESGERYIGCEFERHLSGLVPHKMYRPSRDFPFIDVIVPVYNACDDVLLCLSSLIEKTDLIHRVVVVNDGHDPRTAAMLSAFNERYNHLEVLSNAENLGYTKSVNIGLKHSNANWVVVLNSDTVVSEGWLGKLVNCAMSTESVGMVGPLSNAASWQSVPHIHDNNGDWHLNPIPRGLAVDDIAKKVASLSERAYPDVGVINGFCQLINAKMLDEIGLLDEVAFPVGYGEENDMCARAVKAGYKLLVADDTYVFHAKSKSFGHERRKELAKQGSSALKKKHPDVNWGEITRLVKENPDLVKLRAELVKSLEAGEAAV